MAWTTPKTWSAGETLTAANFNTHIRDNLNAIGPTIIRARLTADATVSSTTFTNVTGITFSIGASEIWSVELHGYAQVADTADYKSTWTVPAGATGHHWANSSSLLGSYRAPIGTDVVLGTATTTDYGIDEYATVINSTTAGTVQFQFAQFSASGTSNIWRANAFMIAYRLS